MESHRLALPSGYRIENYEIQGVLGKGGFGITYVAYDSTLGRHMAIKELLTDDFVQHLLKTVDGIFDAMGNYTAEVLYPLQFRALQN